jgi:hypothetical protein
MGSERSLEQRLARAPDRRIIDAALKQAATQSRPCSISVRRPLSYVQGETLKDSGGDTVRLLTTGLCIP